MFMKQISRIIHATVRVIIECKGCLYAIRVFTPGMFFFCFFFSYLRFLSLSFVLRFRCFLPPLIRRFETSSPMPVQLLLLHDQWMEGGDEDAAHAAEQGEERQLM